MSSGEKLIDKNMLANQINMSCVCGDHPNLRHSDLGRFLITPSPPKKTKDNMGIVCCHIAGDGSSMINI